MMLAGHTKFAPDYHFGIWKIKWRSSDAESLHDIAKTVADSSRSGHNIPQLVQDEEKPVLFFKWFEFFESQFRKMKSITKYHHFTFSCSKPGIVVCKEYVDSESFEFNIMKVPLLQEGLPEIKEAPGLDVARQWYLHDTVAQFFLSDCARQAVCPKPLLPKVKVKTDNCEDKKNLKRKLSR